MMPYPQKAPQHEAARTHKCGILGESRWIGQSEATLAERRNEVKA